MNEITKYDQYLAEMEENIRFYISTPERFAEALIFAKKLENFADMIKEKVKKRGGEIMFDQDIKFIDFGNYRVLHVDPTEVDEYSVTSIFKALEPQIAMALCKVDTGKLKMWLTKSRIEGELLEKITEGKKTKHRKGYIKLMEIKGDEDIPTVK